VILPNAPVRSARATLSPQSARPEEPKAGQEAGTEVATAETTPAASVAPLVRSSRQAVQQGLLERIRGTVGRGKCNHDREPGPGVLPEQVKTFRLVRQEWVSHSRPCRGNQQKACPKPQDPNAPPCAPFKSLIAWSPSKAPTFGPSTQSACCPKTSACSPHMESATQSGQAPFLSGARLESSAAISMEPANTTACAACVVWRCSARAAHTTPAGPGSRWKASLRPVCRGLL
jgi:hypothetical protein